MFTGIVEEVGEVATAGHRLQVNCRAVLAATREGASIAVNGVCLTVVQFDATGFACDLDRKSVV